MLRYHLRIIKFCTYEFQIKKYVQKHTLTLKHDSEKISSISKSNPESFHRHFHIIFSLQDLKKHQFSIKLNKQFQSMPKICLVEHGAGQISRVLGRGRCRRRHHLQISCDILNMEPQLRSRPLKESTNRPPQRG